MSGDRDSDPFGPPAISTEVCCIHCGEIYNSDLIEWQIHKNGDGTERGFWCCPIAGCSGMGFGFDILPTDPNYRDERGGWVHDDLDEDEEWDDEDEEEFSSDMKFSDDFPFLDSDPDIPRNGASHDGDDLPF